MLTIAALSVAPILALAGPAAAAVNDNFQASTTNGCGVVNFIDYGPGAAGGGDNDDYLVIHDYCSDGHGVRGYAWMDTGASLFYLGSQYNGNGLAGAAVVWDPFKPYGNVDGGDYVVIQVCLVDGASDTTPFACVDAGRTSVDG